MHRFPSNNKKQFVFWTLLLSTGLWTAVTWGQNTAEPANENAPLTVTQNSGSGIAKENAPASTVAITPTDPEEADFSISEFSDRMFGAAVEGIGKVLFFRVFSSEVETVAFKEVDYFYRTKGSSTTDFDKLTSGDFPPRAEKTIRAGLLAGQYNETTITDGTLTDSADASSTLEVEYVSITVKSQKYEWDNKLDLFVASKSNLQQVDTTDTMTRSEVQHALLAGNLVVDDDGNHIAIDTRGMPFVVLWLACGAVFFTFFMKGFNIWGVRHAIQVVRGTYDNPDEAGEVTHMQALSSALSATVGLGNIAGVTIAMSMGGPGAFFWMLACGFFGMTSKFVECTLGQKYRRIKPDGSVIGGPMAYLPEGLRQIGLGPLGVVLGFMFTVMCIMGSFGGGNMFQSNQAGSQLLTIYHAAEADQIALLNEQIKTANDEQDTETVTQLGNDKKALSTSIESSAKTFKAIYGFVMAILVGVVIIGGIKSIGSVAEKIVPTMCFIYVLACMFVIVSHITELPALIGLIFTEAFNPSAFGGGMVGVLIIGVQRAAFSNEAGVGSAAIVHSAAKTSEPIREGTVALLEPFIDTIVVCSMTALVILITGAWNNAAWLDEGLAGTALTSRAFASEISWFPYVLTLAVVLFAYSTMISWSYYGERCWETLFGSSKASVYTYKLLFVVAVFVGATAQLGTVLDFSDMMILCMAFPNILGLALLSPGVRRDLLDYWKRFKNGEFKEYH
jgi:alanine or glycine:cation symporter, AGCS family